MISEKIAFRYFNSSVFIHFIGRQLYSIFVPIILLQNGYSLSTVLLFFFFSSFITVISSYLGQKFMAKKSVMYFNFFAIIAEILMLFVFIQNYFTVYALALLMIFEAFYYAFYYLSYDSVLTHYTTSKRVSINLGNLSIAASFSGIIAPLVGVLLLEKNKTYLIATAIFFLFVSLIPLIKIVKTDINGLKHKKIKLKTLRPLIFKMIVTSTYEMVGYFLWALYVYIYGLPLLYIGLVPIISAVVNIIFAHAIKERVANYDFRKMIMFFSVLGLVAVSFYRYFLPEHLIVTSFLFSLLALSYHLGVSTEVFRKLKNHQTYYSSMVLSFIAFSTRMGVSLVALVIGLRYTILLPVLFSVIYMIIYFKSTFWKNMKKPLLKPAKP